MRALRSTPLRLAAGLIAVFVLFLGIGLGSAYGLMYKTLSHEIEDRAEEVIDELEELDDPQAIWQRAQEIADKADSDELIVSLRIGNRRLGVAPDGLRKGVISGRLLDVEDHAPSYLVRTEKIEDGRITVLAGRETIAELNETFMAILWVSVVPALLITSGIAFFVARRTGRRVEAIRTTLHAIGQGNLAARVNGPQPDTDLGDIARDLDRMATAQQAATEALRQIGSDIAHDLKTPIQRVAVHLERLGQADLPAAGHEPLAAAQAETQTIIETFQSLLQIAQLEGGQGGERFGPVQLDALVRDMAEIYAPAFEEAGGALTCEIRAAQPVRGDRHLLSRLIANLVENALRHAPSLPVELVLDGRRLSVIDHGAGIAADQREAVLRRLVRLERSRTTPGSGLGLALVKAIADAHDAELTLSDTQGGGLTVSLTLPVAG